MAADVTTRADAVFADLNAVVEAGLPPIVSKSFRPDGTRRDIAELTVVEAYCAWRSTMVTQIAGHWRWASGERIPMSGSQLHNIRRERGLKQADLAHAIGVGTNNVSLWERGLQNISRRSQTAIEKIILPMPLRPWRREV